MRNENDKLLTIIALLVDVPINLAFIYIFLIDKKIQESEISALILNAFFLPFEALLFPGTF